MIFQIFCISLCILAPLRTVSGGNYYKSFAHSVLESLPDSIKPHFNSVYSQIVQTCAQLETDRFENPDLAGLHFYYGKLPFAGNPQSAPNLVSSIQTSFDSLNFYYQAKNQKKISWFSGAIIHFCSEIAIPHRIHSGFLDTKLYDELVLSEDEKLDSRNSVFKFQIINTSERIEATHPVDQINIAFESNRSLAKEILELNLYEKANKSHSSDRRHKNGIKVMVSLYEGQPEQIRKMVEKAQRLALDLLVSAMSGNQKTTNK